VPLDLKPFLDPATTAVIALEVQQNILLPANALIPGIAANAEATGLVPRLSNLYATARRVGAQMIFVFDKRREDGLGGANNLMVVRAMADGAKRMSHGPNIAELEPEPQDVVINREHGMTGFFTTPLDTYLRNLGRTTVVLTGASANIAVNGTAIEAMNLGYRVIVLSDGIAGDPPEYVEQLLRYTIRNVAMVAPVQAVLDAWSDL
jgi:nicotinamidase-related amidase